MITQCGPFLRDPSIPRRLSAWLRVTGALERIAFPHHARTAYPELSTRTINAQFVDPPEAPIFPFDPCHPQIFRRLYHFKSQLTARLKLHALSSNQEGVQALCRWRAGPTKISDAGYTRSGPACNECRRYMTGSAPWRLNRRRPLQRGLIAAKGDPRYYFYP
jgi:hypothetical protein